MVLVDGGYYQQKRVLLHMPKLSVTRSANAKTIVAPYMKNMFLTLDYTNRADVIQFNEQELEYLYKDNGTIIPEYYWWLENEVISNEDVFDVDIVGVKVNDMGTALAVWTENNWLCIYQRRSPHGRTARRRWVPRMAVDRTRGSSGQALVKSVIFWNGGPEDSNHYIFVALENGIVHSYSLDETEKQKPASFWTFLQDQWPVWTVMSLVISVYVINEVHHHPS
ncbi:hypothetical protein DFQ29_007362 [Apophysomyces sp. BC1021]|nr:hypothetical protein DFQ29_007362 [Apophysomyces sp. BC1021]